MNTAELERRLRAVDLRVTGPRLAVLAELDTHPHADADTIATGVRRRHHPVSTQAVYNVLGVLTERGLVRRIEPAGSPARYENRVGDNHHHIVCRSCGLIGDVDCAVGEAPCLDPGTTHGFVVDEADVTYWGYCPACQTSRAADAAAAPAERHTHIHPAVHIHPKEKVTP